MLAGTVVIVPVGVAAWVASGSPAMSPLGVGLGLASGVFEAAYFVLLAEAYRRGDLSVVYPLARGTAPLLLVVVGVVVLDERLGPAGWVGVALLLVGFLALQRPWQAVRARAGGRRPDAAIAFALATGVMIAGYTSLDRVGTRLIAPFPYATILWVTGAVLLATANHPTLATWLGFAAVVLATINVVGGFVVTHRMLGMFKPGARAKR